MTNTFGSPSIQCINSLSTKEQNFLTNRKRTRDHDIIGINKKMGLFPTNQNNDYVIGIGNTLLCNLTNSIDSNESSHLPDPYLNTTRKIEIMQINRDHHKKTKLNKTTNEAFAPRKNSKAQKKYSINNFLRERKVINPNSNKSISESKEKKILPLILIDQQEKSLNSSISLKQIEKKNVVNTNGQKNVDYIIKPSTSPNSRMNTTDKKRDQGILANNAEANVPFNLFRENKNYHNPPSMNLFRVYKPQIFQKNLLRSSKTPATPVNMDNSNLMDLSLTAETENLGKLPRRHDREYNKLFDREHFSLDRYENKTYIGFRRTKNSIFQNSILSSNVENMSEIATSNQENTQIPNEPIFLNEDLIESSIEEEDSRVNLSPVYQKESYGLFQRNKQHFKALRLDPSKMNNFGGPIFIDDPQKAFFQAKTNYEKILLNIRMAIMTRNNFLSSKHGGTTNIKSFFSP